MVTDYFIVTMVEQDHLGILRRPADHLYWYWSIDRPADKIGPWKTFWQP